MLLDSVYNIFSNDMGIDLGTAYTLVYVRGQGIVLNEPSVVAYEVSTSKVLALGQEAKNMLGRTPGDIIAKRPMKDGVIADFEIVEKMIRQFIAKVNKRRLLVRPRIVVGVPSGITEVEKRAVVESCEQAGARETICIPEALAAAMGANIKIDEPVGHMVIDIGGGTTEIAVISLGGMVVEESIKIAGDEFDEAIMKFLKNQYNLLIGERIAEEAKIRLGNAFSEKKVDKMELKGRDSLTGFPKTLEIDSNEVRKAIKEPLDQILDAVHRVLELTPPELAADIMEMGIVMTGGGSLLKGIDKFIAKETGVPVFRAENPLTCVVMGAGKCLEGLRDRKKSRLR